MAKWFNIFLILLCPPVFIYPQSQNVKFERISVEQGLSQSTVYDILQDSKGFMWFGTEDGLNKYDGYNFTIYRNNPNDISSLSHNYVWSLYEDKSGVIWIGTWGGGLNKYDREKDQFTHYQHDPNNPNSISSNTEMSIFEDNSGILWIGTMNGGLNKLDRKTGYFNHYIHNPDNQNSLSNNIVVTIYEDSWGVLWIGTWNGLNKLNRETWQFTHYKHNPDDPNSLSGNVVVSIYEDKLGMLWIGTENNGLNKFNPENGQFTVYQHDPINQNSLSNNKVIRLHEDKSGMFWVGTWGGGLNKFDRENEQFIHYLHDLYYPNSLSNNAINSMYEDKSNVLWIGTFGGGLNKFDREKAQFTHYQNNPNNPNSLSSNSIQSIYEDKSNVLWIGTFGGGLNKFDWEKNQFTHYQYDPNNTNSLSNNTVNAVFESKYSGRSIVWIGTSNGLNRLDPKTGKFWRYKHVMDNSNSLSDNIVRSICEDRSGIIWIGTRFGGLNRLEPKTGKFTHYLHDPNDPNSLSHNAILTILEPNYSRRDILWIGTYSGLNILDRKTEQFTHYMHDPDDPYSISNNIIRSIYEDQSCILWVGTIGGLNRFDLSTGQFTHFTEEDGLPNNNINGILEDRKGNLWLSTNAGLSKFNPVTKTFRNYDIKDGLLGNEFNIEACLLSKCGKMYFGGVNGLNAFYPDSLKDNPHIPEIVITDFQIFNKPVENIKDDEIKNEDIYLLPKHISTIQELELSYKKNVFSFEFAALDYHSPQKNQYAYKMDGVDPGWVYTDASRRFATYTNLDPGEYIFRVKGSNNDGVWNEAGTLIKIIITPPWWRTSWAYSLYVLLILSMLYGVWRFQTNRLKMKHQLEIEHLHAEKLEEVDRLKSRFFANISHEFRTPLTLIQGPVKQIFSGEFKGSLKETSGMILRYSDRLLNLINQILDLSKLESGRMKLEVSCMDFVQFLKSIVQSFASLAERKKITLKFKAELESISGYIDRDKLEKIVINLLSNAFKFTPEGGEVKVRLANPPESPVTKGGHRGILISIFNSGAGIAPDQLDKIFDRFYQADESYTKDSEGTGIGLALAKELVEAHHGEIRVESEFNKGTTFTIWVPIEREHFKPEEIVEESLKEKRILDIPLHPLDEVVDPSKGEAKISPLEGGARRAGDVSSGIPTEKTVTKPRAPKSAPLLLIVEDNADVTSYIRSFMEKDYRIITAENGEAGLKKALAKFPDLLISDVMMPVMDGFELCRKLKSDERTSHIPVILLTAKADTDSKVEGLEFGADDYVTKPFDARELHARAKNLIEQRKKLHEKFSRMIEVKPGEIVASSMDEQFFRRLLDVFEDHVAQSDFSTEDFAREVGMSRTNLHLKLKALTNQPTHEFLRTLRLKRAAQLLKKSAGTVTEIAYAVGFNNPSYFSRIFRQQFGQTPSEFASKNQDVEPPERNDI